MFKIGEELKLISVDLPTSGLHALLVEVKEHEDGTTILVLRAGGDRASTSGCARPTCEEK